jgi:hypothetical protein
MSARRAVRIGNCSGFYGDRLSAAAEMVEGGPIDVLTGDYLAELTMLILWKAKQKDPATGYATTFLTQMEQVLGTCLDRGIRVVSNAGGLNPAGLAGKLAEVAARLGLAPKIAYIDGDDLTGQLDELLGQGVSLANMDTGQALTEAGIKPVTANAYLGGWGIAEALGAGADVVICPRVTDASLVTGPAAWWHGWGRADYGALAGAVAAGHIIECGAQATGGNYSWLGEITDRRYPGFPIAEVDADGSSVITKHPGTGGLVSPGTATAQLLYEIAEPAYLNPDVVAHFDTLRLEREGPDRVRVSGTAGSPPPHDLKVAINYLGGYRNSMTFVLTGLDIEEKAAWAEQELFAILGGKESFAEVDVRLLRFDRDDAPSNEQATAHLRITVKDPDPRKVGRRFSGATMELALASYAGFHTTTPPTPENAYGVYWPALVPAQAVRHRVVLPDGKSRAISHTSPGGAGVPAGSAVPARPGEALRGPGGEALRGPSGEAVREPVGEAPRGPGGPTRRAPLGTICAARSGDKGGNANVGLWTRDAAGYGWLRGYLTAGRLKELLPEAAGLDVRRYELPNLYALNFVIVGLLGDGVAASTRPDPQAKGLGEYLRSRHADIPVALLGGHT